MSQYFTFYLARKEDNKYNYVAPFDADGKPYALLVCSRSFINSDDFRDIGHKLWADDLDETLTKISGNGYTTAYAISLADMRNLRDRHNGGLYVGYVDIHDLNTIIAHNYRLEYSDDVELINPAVVAEMDDDETLYHTAFIADCDSSYYANLLLETIRDIYPEKDLYFIFDTEY